MKATQPARDETRVDPASQRPKNAEESVPEALVPNIVRSRLRDGLDGGERTPSRLARIQRRAYEIAEERGFSSGAELEDWLRAEREIDSATMPEAPERQFTG